MDEIKKKYIVDDNNRRVAVQIDYDTFEKIEELLENYALVQLIDENEGEDILDIKEAKAQYNYLEKAD